MRTIRQLLILESWNDYRGWKGRCFGCVLRIVLKIKAYLSVIVHPVKITLIVIFVALSLYSKIGYNYIS